MTPLAALEVLGQVRLFGLPAENVGHGVLLVNRDHVLTLTSEHWTLYTDEGVSLATFPSRWDAEAVAASVVCVLFLNATPVSDEVAA